MATRAPSAAVPAKATPSGGGGIIVPPPPSNTSYVIQVPMRLDAFVNYDARVTTSNGTQSRAYTAPITSPNFQALQMKSSLIQHEIYEDLREAPYLSAADRSRQVDGRQGIYLHWTLPRLYRTGITGSDSAADKVTQQKGLGGFPASNANSDSSAPAFRPIPTRWVIWRTIRGISWDNRNEEDSRQKPKVVGIGATSESFYDYTNGPPSDSNTIHDCFVVQSDAIRSIKNVGATEDVEVTSSPYLDPVGSTAQQGVTFRGQSMRMTAWNGDGATPPQPQEITISQPFNPFFADYQPQNASVLSFFDDLSIPQGALFYSEADVSYTVMGYHVTKEADPLYVKTFPAQALSDRLAAANLAVDPLSSTLDPSFKNNMRTLCFGNMYKITWRQPPPPNDSMTSMSFPADNLQQLFLKEHPLSVGTNAIDALFGWLRSTNASSGLATDEMRRNLLKLQTLVLDINDDLDSQLQAEDLLATNNFVPSAGQVTWHFKAPDEVPDSSQPTIPTDEQATALRLLNNLQMQCNATQREYDNLRSQLFAAFWRYMADQGNWTPDQRTVKLATAQSEVSTLTKLISTDITTLGQLKGQISQMQSKMVLQAGVERLFTVQRDPTLLVAGMQSQWPPDWNEDLRVRLNPQTNMNVTKGYPAFNASAFGGKVPVELQDQMAILISEAELAYGQKQTFKSTPMYFPSSDRYQGKQGWFPLFVQWEVEYYHIPFELWEFSPQGPEARIGYSLVSDASVTADSITGDYRIVSGRSPLLPQPGSILEATLRQVFSKINPNDQINSQGIPMTDMDRQALLAAVRALDFSSTPMSGFTDQLLTQMQGSHVTPIQFDATGKPVITSDPNIVKVATDLGLTGDSLRLMQGVMAATPYASLVDIQADPSKYTPFKSCIHGQFRFTKLDIVDKFGQIVRGVEQMTDIAKNIGPTKTPVFPSLGDSYSVEAKSDGTANVVLPRSDKLNSFVQLPPSISQPARVNANFVSQDTPPQWRQLDEWENPVRGWIVVNQANISLQVFSPDGYFIREYGVTNSYPVTRPFPADEDLVASLDPIMQALMSQFASPGWIAGFFRTLTQTTDEVQANPSSYSESMLSVLGRPLAVTAFGVSLELSIPPKTNQSTLAPTDPKLLGKDLLSYKFGLKIGDKNNVFDGLLGLFTASPDLTKGLSVNFNSFYSYHSPDVTETQILGDPSKPMLDDLSFQPFYPDPHAANYSLECAKSQQIFVGIIDPFTALNIYTAILPIAQLKLPPWTIENGLSHISTFFKLGPILVPGDVAPFNNDSAHAVKRDYRLGDENTEPQENGSILVPAVGIGDWGWLQPYYDGGETKYNLLGIDPAIEKPGYEPVPYTAVEGYLQQKRPFTKPDPMQN